MEPLESLPPIELAIVIPTFNEGPNVLTLIERLHHTLGLLEWEAIFVDDDSPDGTASILREAARGDRRVRVIQRIGRHGLASACIEGMLATAAPFIAVMDADLQHDESILPRMYEQIKTEHLDLVVGSRVAEGGSMGELPEQRVVLSKLGSRLYRSVASCRLSDPMSGYFIVDRSFLEEVVHRLSGVGFKVLVDLVASVQRPIRFAEFPYRFRKRERGESKLDVNVGLEYLQLLVDKSIGHIVPSRFVLFGLVGGLGVLIHLAVLVLLYFVAGLGFIYAQVGATLVAMTCNFLVNNLTTFRDRRLRGSQLFRGLFSYYAACSIGAVANFSLARFLFTSGLPWYLAGVLGMAVSSVWNYGVNVLFTWRRGAGEMQRRSAAIQARIATRPDVERLRRARSATD
jgi:dolichol-phosphate mannosyltransferase